MSESLIQNKKAYFNYEIMEKFSAGMELFGFEVKAIKDRRGSLEGAYVVIRGGEAFLVGANILPIQPKNVPADYDSHRNRKLLLTKKEIKKLADAEGQKGLTIVATSVYNSNRKLKIEIAIAKGKRHFDKRKSIMKRELDREDERTLKNG